MMNPQQYGGSVTMSLLVYFIIIKNLFILSARKGCVFEKCISVWARVCFEIVMFESSSGRRSRLTY